MTVSMANAFPLLLVAVTLYISTTALSFEDCEATGDLDESCQDSNSSPKMTFRIWS